MHDTIGIDLVGMVVDDLVVCGAEPLFMTDYIACGKVVPERIADDRRAASPRPAPRPARALVGGETAEHPGLLGPDEYDVAGAAVGVVEADALLGADRVRAGDVVIAMASSGLHSNGYSLVRHVLAAARLGWTSTGRTSSAGRSARSCSSRPGSTRAAAASCSPTQPEPSTRSATSPAAASPPTWPGCSRWAPGSRWTARPGRRRPCSGC